MKKTFLLIALLGALACPAQDAKPDFSGKWTLDAGKSDFGPMPAPSSQVHVIEHKDPKLKVTTTTKSQQGDRTSEASYTTDGKENANPGFGGQEVKSTTKWDGKKLVTQRKVQAQGMDIEIKDTWELAEDSNGFNVTRDLKTPQGDFTQKMVYAKE